MAAKKKAAKKKATTKKATTKRTTLRSTTGTKLYVVRNVKGEFKDIQTYKRAQGPDEKRVSKAETAARKKAGLPARKAAKKK
jgi:DNA-binding protein HU-beta